LLLPGDGDPESVRDALDRGSWALIDYDHQMRMTKNGMLFFPVSRYPPVVTAGNWTLVHRAPAPQVQLGPPRPFKGLVIIN
jgi:hypothetical protein